ncbi:MAG: amidohydrolase, partial [Acidisphaera sp.]|nr:amidohydrolase [Acidisphaera sp.]
MDETLHRQLVAWRRHLHAHPELSLGEKQTAAFVCARLGELGIPYIAGVGGHGVVATLRRGASNRSVGLRADMDALPIEETTGLAHASTSPGVMHACGHDGHTTSLLGAAAVLQQDASWSGTVHLVFQPAEEGAGGARAMVADGLFDRFPMERIFAYHNWPGLEAGTVAVHDGPVMAGGSRIAITLRGVAGHAAMPHLARDPMLAAGHLIVALQSIVAREVDPLETAVVSICVVESGRAANQIPESVTLRGTARTFKDSVRDRVRASVVRISEGIAATFGVVAHAEMPPGISPVANTQAEAAIVASAAEAAGLPVRRDLPPSMASEDFGHFLRERPGAFLWVGNGPATDGTGLHNPG